MISEHDMLERFEKVRPVHGGWMACCPAHDDRNPSLSVTLKDDRWLLRCHAGCAAGDVLAAVDLEWGDLFSENGKREIVETYPYVDEAGELLFQVVRFWPKDFRQRRPDGAGGWSWKLGDTRRVLYRLPRVLEAVKGGERVYVVEGEKDVHALERAGVTASCNPMGAGKWRREYGDPLRGAAVLVIADRDEAGYDHARKVARALQGVAAQVELFEPTRGMDIADHLAVGGDLEELAELPRSEGAKRDERFLSDLFVDDILRKRPDLDREQVEGIESADELKKLLGRDSKADIIVRLVREAGTELFHDAEGVPYATFKTGDHEETCPVRSRAFKLHCRKLYYDSEQGAPPGQSLTDALGALEAHAIFEGEEHEVYRRVAGGADVVYLDLCDAGWNIVAIDREGWRVVERPPVRFTRARGMLALPFPKDGGNLGELRLLANIPEPAWPLIAGFLVGMAHPGGRIPCSSCTARPARRSPLWAAW